VLAPAVFQLAPRFFIGVGPTFTTYLWTRQGDTSLPNTSVIGLRSMVGGYFRGAVRDAFARVGYDIAFSPVISIWPRIAVGYRHVTSDLSTGTNVTASGVQLAVQAPVLFRPSGQFFIGGGPTFTTDLSSKQDSARVAGTTIIGLQSTLGGYFQGL
jgi:hypothetical protein